MESLARDLSYEAEIQVRDGATMADKALVEWARGLPDFDGPSFRESEISELRDADPYFLRSQSWKNAQLELDESELATDFDSNSVSISLNQSGLVKSFVLQRALKPLLVTDTFVYLNAQSQDFFKEKSSTWAPQQGLFVLKISDLRSSFDTQDPVPVYFAPLPGEAWVGDLGALQLPSLGSFVIEDAEGEWLPIEESDIQSFVQLGENSLVLSLLESTLHQLPVPRSTMGYGLFFIGQNLGDVDSSMVPDSKSHTWMRRILKNLLPIETAYAEGIDAEDIEAGGVSAAPSGLSADDLKEIAAARARVWSRLIRTSIILGAGLTAGIVLRYTLYKDVFRERRAKRAQTPVTLMARAKLNAREVLDVYSHVLTIFSQFSSVSYGYLVQYHADKRLTRFAASRESWLGWFLDRCVAFAKNSMSRMPTNAKALWKGFGIIGMTDTAGVWAQLYHVNPALAHLLPEVLPFDGVRQRVGEVFGEANAKTEILNQNEVFRNGIAYAVSAPITYTSQLKPILEQRVSAELEAEYARAHKNLSDPTVAKEFETEKQKRIEAELVRQGLPGSDEFLFDLGTFYSWLLGKRGFSPSAQASQTQSAGDPRDFLSITRPGLVLGAAKVLREYLESRSAENCASVNSALEVLNGLNDEFSFWSLASSAQVITNREILSALSKPGDVLLPDAAIPPILIERFGLVKARAFCFYYRQILFGLMSDNQVLLKGPTAEEKAAQDFAGEKAAVEELLVRKGISSGADGIRLRMDDGNPPRPTGLELSAEVSAAVRTHVEEFELVKQKHFYINAMDARKARLPYEDPTLAESPLVHARKEVFYQRAAADFQTHFEQPWDPNIRDAAQIQYFRERYAAHLMEFLHLSPDYKGVVGLAAEVDQKTRLLVEGIFADQKFLAYLEDLSHFSPEERAKERAIRFAHIIASCRVAAYQDLTSRNPKLDTLSTAQPGRLQKWRQAGWVKKADAKLDGALDHVALPLSHAWTRITNLWKAEDKKQKPRDNYNAKLMTRMLRVYEGTLPEGEFGLGIWSQIQRNVPLVFDMSQGILRTVRNMPTSLVAAYLWYRLVWGSNQSWVSWFWFMLFGFTISGPAQTLTRVLDYQNMKPMGSDFDTFKFAFIYTWATFWGTIPMYLLLPEFEKIWGGALGAYVLGLGISAGKHFFKKRKREAIMRKEANAEHKAPGRVHRLCVRIISKFHAPKIATNP